MILVVEMPPSLWAQEHRFAVERKTRSPHFLKVDREQSVAVRSGFGAVPNGREVEFEDWGALTRVEFKCLP